MVSQQTRELACLPRPDRSSTPSETVSLAIRTVWNSLPLDGLVIFLMSIASAISTEVLAKLMSRQEDFTFVNRLESFGWRPVDTLLSWVFGWVLVFRLLKRSPEAFPFELRSGFSWFFIFVVLSLLLLLCTALGFGMLIIPGLYFGFIACVAPVLTAFRGVGPLHAIAFAWKTAHAPLPGGQGGLLCHRFRTLVTTSLLLLLFTSILKSPVYLVHNVALHTPQLKLSASQAHSFLQALGILFFEVVMTGIKLTTSYIVGAGLSLWLSENMAQKISTG